MTLCSSLYAVRSGILDGSDSLSVGRWNRSVSKKGERRNAVPLYGRFQPNQLKFGGVLLGKLRGMRSRERLLNRKKWAGKTPDALSYSKRFMPHLRGCDPRTPERLGAMRQAEQTSDRSRVLPPTSLRESNRPENLGVWPGSRQPRQSKPVARQQEPALQ
jgi:hypothetical protein